MTGLPLSAPRARQTRTSALARFAPALLLLLALRPALAAAAFPKHKLTRHAPASHTASHVAKTTHPARTRAATRRTASHTTTRTIQHSRSTRNARSRTPRYRTTVDPVSRLDAISAIAATLSRGASALSYPGSLDRFYAALATHEDAPDQTTVRVLQFGDSHTAADMFTGEARRVIQHQFGNGSVGFSYAGHPFAGYRIFGSQRSQSGGWATEGTHFGDLGDGLLGMGGIGVSANRPGEFVTLDAPCASLQLDFLEQPGGGALELTDNGTPVTALSTAASTTAPGTYTYICPEPPAGSTPIDHHFVVTTRPPAQPGTQLIAQTGDPATSEPTLQFTPQPGAPSNLQTSAPVRLFGLTALQPGVTWESIGINGAEAPLILRWNQTLFTTYLHNAQASLIVLAYGTNEAAAAHWDREAYTDVFTRLIDKLHATAPDASILVLGPTDRATAARRRGYTPFLGTDRILEAQRDVCRTHDCSFWDQRKRMGGLGIMQRWVRAGWAQPDHTHMTGEGYRALADALLADILSAYDRYRVAHGLNTGAATPHPVQLGQEPASTTQTH